MKYLKTFVGAILAGLMISIGGTVYLACMADFKVIGAVLFSAGLMTVCFYSLNLYTGKVCYLFDNKPSFLIDLLIIWVGNLVGAVLTALAVKFSLPTVAQTAAAICTKKYSQNPFQSILLGLFCGILVFISVDVFKQATGASRFIGIFTCIPLFILAGFEHSVADMFYVFVADGTPGMSVDGMLFLLYVTIGNSVGGVILPLFRKYTKSKTNT